MVLTPIPLTAVFHAVPVPSNAVRAVLAMLTAPVVDVGTVRMKSRRSAHGQFCCKWTSWLAWLSSDLRIVVTAVPVPSRSWLAQAVRRSENAVGVEVVDMG